jgi:hypothetical protein
MMVTSITPDSFTFLLLRRGICKRSSSRLEMRLPNPGISFQSQPLTIFLNTCETIKRVSGS